MQTAGQALKKARLKKGISFEQAEEATKINQRFLKALEESDYSSLPSLPSIKGFLKNYGEYLGLSADWLWALFRREYRAGSSPALLPLAASGSLFPSWWTVIQNKFFFALVIIAALVFLTFLGRGFLVPPPLVLDAPPDNFTTAELNVEVVGQTDPEANLTINDQPVTLKEEGRFEIRIQLAVGANRLEITATNRLGRSQTLTRTVTVSPFNGLNP